MGVGTYMYTLCLKICVTLKHKLIPILVIVITVDLQFSHSLVNNSLTNELKITLV